MEVLTISKQELQINEEIRDKEILVIDADGTKLGVLSARDAQEMAFNKNLDLVKIAPQATPPCAVSWTTESFALNSRSVKRKQEKIRRSFRSRRSECSPQLILTILKPRSIRL